MFYLLNQLLWFLWKIGIWESKLRHLSERVCFVYQDVLMWFLYLIEVKCRKFNLLFSWIFDGKSERSLKYYFFLYLKSIMWQFHLVLLNILIFLIKRVAVLYTSLNCLIFVLSTKRAALKLMWSSSFDWCLVPKLWYFFCGSLNMHLQTYFHKVYVLSVRCTCVNPPVIFRLILLWTYVTAQRHLSPNSTRKRI